MRTLPAYMPLRLCENWREIASKQRSRGAWPCVMCTGRCILSYRSHRCRTRPPQSRPCSVFCLMKFATARISLNDVMEQVPMKLLRYRHAREGSDGEDLGAA